MDDLFIELNEFLLTDYFLLLMFEMEYNHLEVFVETVIHEIDLFLIDLSDCLSEYFTLIKYQCEIDHIEWTNDCEYNEMK